MHTPGVNLNGMHLFLSYPSEHLNAASDVYAFLKGLGLDVWFDKARLLPGQDWQREIGQAQAAADLTVLLCGGQTVTRPGVVQTELRAALELERRAPLGTIYLVPVRVEQVRLPSEITRFQYVDYFSPGWKAPLAKSIASAHVQRNAPPPPALSSFIASSEAVDTLEYDLVTLQEKRSHTDVYARYPVYRAGGRYWQYVNACIVVTAFDAIHEAVRNGGEAAIEQAMHDRQTESDASVNVEEFFRSGEIVSLRSFVSGYTAGAAHGYLGVSSLNLFGENFGKAGIHSVLRADDQTRAFLRLFIRTDMARQVLMRPEVFGGETDDPVSCIWLEDDTDTMRLCTEFNVSRAGLTANFSPYAITAYAAGEQEVTMPWSALDPFLVPGFKAQILPVICGGTP